MKQVLPIHLIALTASGAIALWVNNLYLWERPWALLLMLLAVGYTILRTVGSRRFGTLFALIELNIVSAITS